MSLLNPDLSNLEIKIDSIVITERKEVVKVDGTEHESNTAVCVAFKANRNDIVFIAEPGDAINEYGLDRLLVKLTAEQPMPYAARFMCKTNGATGSFNFTNLKAGVGTLATITLDDSEGGEGGAPNG